MKIILILVLNLSIILFHAKSDDELEECEWKNTSETLSNYI